MLSTFTTTVRSDIELELEPEETKRAREAHDREHAPLVEARRQYEEQVLPARFEKWLAEGAPRAPVAAWEFLEAATITSKAALPSSDWGTVPFSLPEPTAIATNTPSPP